MGRIAAVDALRGIAILLMIVYHFFFDLDFFGFIDINLFDAGWLIFQRSVAVLFLLVVGISLTLSESKNKEGYKRHAKRGLRLAGVAMLITAATWIYPHKGFIMFGIIHFIAAATLIAPFFLRFGWKNVLLGLVIILAGFYVDTLRTDSTYLFWLGIVYPGYQPLDHYSIIPWLGIVLIGIYAGKRLLQQKSIGMPGWAGGLAFLGRHALLIYLIHQPILIGALLGYRMLL
jgi:uncharacterized membrane protein